MRHRGLGLLCAALALGCQRTPAPAAPDAAAARPAPTAPRSASPAAHPPAPDWAAMHAAEAACADCHPDEVEAWGRSAMGRSLARVDATQPAPAGVPTSVRHPVDGHTWAVAKPKDQPLQFSVAGPDFTVTRTARYAVGSATHTRSYLWQQGDALFMAPLTWYTRPKAWSLSPGYEVHDHPGLDRLVQADCLTCHADPPAQRPGQPHRWVGDVPGAIGCSRCHGDGRAHIQAREAGRAGPPMVNPARLPPDRANAVCEGCHLQGVARLTRAGRPWGSFTPGDRLEDHVAVFVRKAAGAAFGIASHGARLRHSACRAPGGQPLTCVTCHSPHPTGAQAQADRSSACRGCHGADDATHGAACAGPGGQDCVSCHMRVAEVDDIPHVAVTDHFIRRSATDTLPPPPADAPLVWVADPQEEPADPTHQRLLGRAYADAVRGSGRPADLARAQRLLKAGLDHAPDDLEALLAQAFVAVVAGDAATARAATRRAASLAPTDPRVAEHLVALRLAEGRAPDAAAAATRAVEAHRDVPQLHVRLAHALAASGQGAAAIAASEEALRLRPLWGPAWVAKATGQLASGAPDVARATLAQATQRDPSHTAAWLALGRLSLQVAALDPAQAAYAGALQHAAPEDLIGRATASAGLARVALARGDVPGASAHFQGALAPGVPVPGLFAATGAMALARARPADAQRALEASLRADPDDPLAWADLARAKDALGDPQGAAQARARAGSAAKVPAVRSGGPKP